jgi:DNA-binding beta-propeller fold protein YncE
MLQDAPGALALPPGGRSLYVSHSVEDHVPQGEGSNIVRFTFDATGRLTPAETIPTCAGPRASVFTPDLRFAYVSCIFDGQIGLYSVAADGALTSIGQLEFPGASGIVMAPNGQTLYVSNGGESRLAAFRVGSNGLLTPLNSVDTEADPPAKGVAVTPDGRFIYVSHGEPRDTDDSVLTGFALGADGSLGSQVAEVPNGRAAFDTVITPDGRFVYVAAALSNSVFGYRINSDGSLTAVPGQSFPSGVFSVGAAISPDGRRIYIAALGTVIRNPPGEVSGWAIGADGALSEIERLTTDDDDDVVDPVGLEFAPSGRHLFVAEFFNDDLIAFGVSPHGTLTKIQTVDSGGFDPTSESITILPNLGPTASFSVWAGAAGSASRFDGTTSVDPDGRVARYDWDFGDGKILRNGGPTPRHIYRAPGTYTARLTVVDDEGCSAQLVFTGQNPSCLGTGNATTTRTVVVR